MDKVVDRLAAVAMSEPGKAFAGARLGVRPARCARVDANTTSGSCPSDSNSRTNARQPSDEADADALRQAIEHPELAAVGIRETREAMRFGSAFILGMIVTHVLLGFIAGLGASEPRRGGEPLTRDYAPTPMLSPTTQALFATEALMKTGRGSFLMRFVASAKQFNRPPRALLLPR
jgi:hypothetical protein